MCLMIFKLGNQQSYNAALNYYLANDFSLVHLGDIEELKEQWSIGDVLKFNQSHLSQESLFHKKIGISGYLETTTVSAKNQQP